MAIDKILDFGKIKSLSKEQRINFAYQIRRDSDLWNAVNGIGGLSEFSEMARIQGTITKENEALPKVKIEIYQDKNKLHELVSNASGYFKIDIVPGNYQVNIFDGDNKESVSVKALKGVTSTLNHNFKRDGGGLL